MARHHERLVLAFMLRLITPESYLFLPSNIYGDDENLWRPLIRTLETLEYDIRPEHTLSMVVACSILDTVTITSSNSTSYVSVLSTNLTSLGINRVFRISRIPLLAPKSQASASRLAGLLSPLPI
ncbi:hypothetical protein VNO77_05244 [Canavalia gladiata]|uniref:Uncharacterized protein n=1 Tax=Canavalia gladiata TaxID=3824 RepID=A0AAN9N3P4_CANGL